jgi:hypothetical protein
MFASPFILVGAVLLWTPPSLSNYALNAVYFMAIILIYHTSYSPVGIPYDDSLGDGCISYLHTGASHPEGGYEVDAAPLAYRYPGRLQADCERIALEMTNTLLHQLWS